MADWVVTCLLLKFDGIKQTQREGNQNSLTSTATITANSTNL